MKSVRSLTAATLVALPLLTAAFPPAALARYGDGAVQGPRSPQRGTVPAPPPLPPPPPPDPTGARGRDATPSLRNPGPDLVLLEAASFDSPDGWGVRQATSPGGLLQGPGMEMFSAEWQRLMQLAGAVQPQPSASSAALVPLRGLVTSLFGEIRSYLDGPAATAHQGVDIAAPTGTPVVAAQSGVVVLADAWPIRGNAVVVDHGGGTHTGYYHLNTIQVIEGQAVARGQVLGTVGATGLATGPHLHWDVVIQGGHVDPLTWALATGNPDLGTLVLAGPARDGVSPYHDRGLGAVLRPDLISDGKGHGRDVAVGEGREVGGLFVDPDAQRQADAAARAEEARKALEARVAAVRQAYIDLLGRDPMTGDAAGLQAWVDSGLPVPELRGHLAVEGSGERAGLVRQMYVDYLGRDPLGTDDAGVASWVQTGLPLADIRDLLMKAGRAERIAAIRQLYIELLGRDPAGTDNGGLAAWADGGLPIAEIRQRLTASDEHQQRAKR